MDRDILEGNNPLDSIFSKKTLLIAGSFLCIYLLWLNIFIGFRTDHFFFILSLCVAYFITPTTRKLVLSFVFFWIFWFIYDAMRLYPNYNFNPIHIIEPYTLEKSLFGISTVNGLLTPNEYLIQSPNKISDLLSGIFYLTWVPLPMMYCIYLFFTDKTMLLKFSATFLFANIVGFIIYYLYPAAPPWYYSEYGNIIDFDIPGDAAQLIRFDQIFGYPLFENMYNKNANVFAAIPSLHSAYPVILTYFAFQKKSNWFKTLCIIDVLGIWYAAVYSNHHYIIDVILGAFCAIFAIFVFNLILKKSYMRSLIDKYAKFIA